MPLCTVSQLNLSSNRLCGVWEEWDDYKDCRVQKGTYSAEGIKAFGEHMAALYSDRVNSGCEPRSFLSHSEGLHSGLSGVHFLRTLAVDDALSALAPTQYALAPSLSTTCPRGAKFGCPRTTSR